MGLSGRRMVRALKRKDKSVGIEYAAPWRQGMPDGNLGPEYNPISVRTGRAVAQDSAQRDYAQSFHAIDSGGMHDHRENAAGSTRERTKPRYDEEAMAAFVRIHGNDLSGHQWEVYTRFWAERRSYRAIAALFGCSAKNINGTVIVLRRKLAANRRGSQPTLGQVVCPNCQAPTRVSKTKHSAGVTKRLRKCTECGHGFATAERPE